MLLAAVPTLCWPTEDYSQEEQYDPNIIYEYETGPNTEGVPNMEQNLYKQYFSQGMQNIVVE